MLYYNADIILIPYYILIKNLYCVATSGLIQLVSYVDNQQNSLYMIHIFCDKKNPEIVNKTLNV